ncbi:MAG: hypothetical protein ACRENX_01540 [Candidatus Dormibacteria bacterium]
MSAFESQRWLQPAADSLSQELAEVFSPETMEPCVLEQGRKAGESMVDPNSPDTLTGGFASDRMPATCYPLSGE